MKKLIKAATVVVVLAGVTNAAQTQWRSDIFTALKAPAPAAPAVKILCAGTMNSDPIAIKGTINDKFAKLSIEADFFGERLKLNMQRLRDTKNVRYMDEVSNGSVKFIISPNALSGQTFKASLEFDPEDDDGGENTVAELTCNVIR